MLILGIETSCDETAISIVEAKGGLDKPTFRVLSHIVHSQIKEHEEFGGVVPNIAKREHQKYLPIVLEKALEEAGIGGELSIMNHELWMEKNVDKSFPIDLIAVTVGPGLEPALWTGIEFAKDLSKKWQIPIVGANHMEGHIASVLLNKTEEMTNHKSQNPNSIIFPAVALLISGGHTELVRLDSWTKKEKIGQTLDDAVGEAYDKVARMLGLSYPGGPEISKLANEAREKGIEANFKFPRPMMHSKDLNFSFSGLKTAVLYYLRDREKKVAERTSGPDESRGGQESKVTFFSLELKQKVAYEFEEAVTEVLVSKTKKALEQTNAKTLIVGGGVIANKYLRLKLQTLGDECGVKTLIPEKMLTTDNATMIAATGYLQYVEQGANNADDLKANGNQSI